MLSVLLRSWLVLVASYAAPYAAHAAPPAPDGTHLYAGCTVCHGMDAWGSPEGSIPSLAGQQRRYLEAQLASFRSGVRVDPAMQPVSAHPALLDPSNVGVLVEFISNLPPDPHPVTGPGKHLRLGQETYTHICTGCHGVDGRGEPLNRVPRIAGQHYPYLKRQIDALAQRHREVAPPEMTNALQSMSEPQKDAVADYLSRLGSSEPLLDANRSRQAPQ